MNRSSVTRLPSASGEVSSKCLPFVLLIIPLMGMCRSFVPKYFEQDISTGMPTLTEEGRKALEEELSEKSEHTLEDVTPTSVTPSSKSD